MEKKNTVSLRKIVVLIYVVLLVVSILMSKVYSMGKNEEQGIRNKEGKGSIAAEKIISNQDNKDNEGIIEKPLVNKGSENKNISDKNISDKNNDNKSKDDKSEELRINEGEKVYEKKKAPDDLLKKMNPPIKKEVYLTFDDGPSIDATPKILDILKENNIKATFFVTGNMCRKNPNVLKRIIDEGHSAANHSFSHNYKIMYKSCEQLKEEVIACEKEVEKIAGKNKLKKIFRFPGGSAMANVDCKNLIKELGYEYIDWNSLTEDAVGKKKTPSELYNNFLKNSKGKKRIVLLMHDYSSRINTAKALPKIIKYLRDEDYEFKSFN